MLQDVPSDKLEHVHECLEGFFSRNPGGYYFRSRESDDQIRDLHKGLAEEDRNKLRDLACHLLVAKIGFDTMESRDRLSFQETVREYAETYLDARALHLPVLTDLLLVNLLDAEIAPLQRQAKKGIKRSSLENYFPRFGWVVRVGIKSLLAIVGWIGIGLLFTLTEEATMVRPVVWFLSAWLAWQIFQAWRETYTHQRATSELLAAAHNMETIRKEIDSGCYDGAEIARRLRNFEQEPNEVLTLMPNSLMYPLLDLRRRSIPTAEQPVNQ